MSWTLCSRASAPAIATDRIRWSLAHAFHRQVPFLAGRVRRQRQRSSLSSSSSSTHESNPYNVLGCDPSADWNQVKRAFVERAKEYHPDMAARDTRSSNSTESFIRCRQALEQIRESLRPINHNSGDKNHNKTDWRDDEDFEDWFYDATGADWLGFAMEDTAREEVNKLYKFASKGLMRGWEVEMACFPKHATKSRPQQLESGLGVSATASASPQRRRRRR